MNKKGFSLPTLITYRSSRGYGVRPLLFPLDCVWHKRISKAHEMLQREITQVYGGVETSRETIEPVLWLGFAPDYHYTKYEFSFKVEKLRLHGLFGAIQFTLYNQSYVILPLLNHLCITLTSASKDKQTASTEIESAIKNFLQDTYSTFGEDYDYEDYLSSGKDFCSSLDINVAIKPGKIRFEPDYGFSFASMFEPPQFDGAEEIRKVGHVLNDLYPDKLQKAYFREELTSRVREQLFQPDHTSLCLLGAKGCGKTSLIHSALTDLIESDSKQSHLKKSNVWYIDPLRIITGMSIVGMWERRFESIIAYVSKRKKRKKKNILYINNIIALFRIGKTAQTKLTIANVLKPYLEQRSLSLLVETTPEQWEKVQEYDRRFADLFQVIRIDTPPTPVALKMLSYYRIDLERQYQNTFSTDALRLLWRLLKRVPGTTVLPGLAANILQQLASNAEGQINPERVLDYFAEHHQFTDRILNYDKTLSDREIRLFFDHRLIGQSIAKNGLTEVIHRIKSGMVNSSRPLSTLLFIGPTGVGKTETAKILNEFLFGSQDSLVRFDMNEYIDHDAVARLVGDFHNPEGLLTSRIRQKPACVLLLDEIEKAHGTVHNLLLQLLGEARLTDALGRTTDFSQCVVIMTSNLGAAEANKEVGFVNTKTTRQHTYREAVQRFFNPEFVNRIDKTLLFEELSREEVLNISTILIQKIFKRDGLNRRASFLQIERDALYKIASESFDPKMGARALKRNLEKSLVNHLARKLVTIPPEQSILFDINLKDEQLNILIHEIDYSGCLTLRLPKVLNQELINAYHVLNSKIETLLESLNQAVDQRPDDKIYLWSVAEEIRELKNRVSKICWDIESWSRQPIKDSEFNLNMPATFNDWYWYEPERGNWSSYFKSKLDVNYLVNAATPLRQIIHGKYLQDYLSYWLHNENVESALEKSETDITLEFTSLVDNVGQEALAYLVQRYVDFLEMAGATTTTGDSSSNQTSITIQHSGLLRSLQAETGLHIIDVDGQLTIPILLTCKYDNKVTQQTLYKVIRFYRINSDQSASVLDLKSGLICTRTLLPHEMLMFFVHGDSHEPI